MSQAGICKYIVQGLYVTTCRQVCAGMKVFARRVNRYNGTTYVHILLHKFRLLLLIYTQSVALCTHDHLEADSYQKCPFRTFHHPSQSYMRTCTCRHRCRHMYHGHNAALESRSHRYRCHSRCPSIQKDICKCSHGQYQYKNHFYKVA